MDSRMRMVKGTAMRMVVIWTCEDILVSTGMGSYLNLPSSPEFHIGDPELDVGGTRNTIVFNLCFDVLVNIVRRKDLLNFRGIVISWVGVILSGGIPILLNTVQTKVVVLLMVVAISIPNIALAGKIEVFQDGTNKASAYISQPDSKDIVNLTILAQCHIVKASLNVSISQPSENGTEFLDGPSISIDNSTIWRFNSTGFGDFGLQDGFSNGLKEINASFSSAGGTLSGNIRLPRNAKITDASLDISCEGPEQYIQKSSIADHILGSLGNSVANVGDINGDGYSDIIVGAPAKDAGAVEIFFGGDSLDTNPGMIINGTFSGDEFGWSVYGAGDVNHDGYAGFIVGAPYAGQNTGRAYIFFGGKTINQTPDLVLTNSAPYAFFGDTVSSAGDLNNDGFDDVIVGAPYSSSYGPETGVVYAYYGGAQMDTIPDLTFIGAHPADIFGYSICSVGDINNDSFDDILIGAYNNNSCGMASGSAYLFYGGQNMDNISDLNFTGEKPNNWFGASVFGAGDVNNDGFPDIVIGAPYNSEGGTNAGKAYIFYGGPDMDNISDQTFLGQSPSQLLGYAVSSAGDYNNDGYDDIILGLWADSSNGFESGQAYLYYGGSKMSLTPDIIFSDSTTNDRFGWSVSSAGDFDKDGWDDVIIGAPGGGFVNVYGHVAGPMISDIKIGSISIIKREYYASGEKEYTNIEDVVNSYIRTNTFSGNDSYGNIYSDLPIKITASSEGKIALSNVNISYEYSGRSIDFSDTLNQYITRHKSEADPEGNLTVPLEITAKTPGTINLSNLTIVTDTAPELVQDIPNHQIDEDVSWTNLVDLHDYFRDDFDSADQMTFNLVSATNSSIVNVKIIGNQFLAVDTFENLQNTSWSGIVTIVLSCADHRGSTTFSNPFNVVVKHVNHSPVITSVPNVTATGGQNYEYQVLATDIDNDTLKYNLTSGPENMILNQTTGSLQWVPKHWGKFSVVLTVSDGLATVSQQFNINVLNRHPRLMSQTIPSGFVGRAFTYDIPVMDDDGDALEYTLVSNWIGMQIDSSTGELTWTPLQTGDYPVSVRISDSQDYIYDNFTITVIQGNRAPVIHSSPVIKGISEVPYTYKVNATDADNDILNYSLVVMPEGMTMDASSGLISWTPSSSGNYSVKIRVFDGKDGEAFQTFVISVAQKILPTVQINKPVDGQTIRGKYTIQGTVTRGTLEVVNIQFRIDNNAWMNLAGNNTWSYVLDTTTFSNAKHVFEVRAFDGTDYSNATVSNFTINNSNNQSAESISRSLGIGGIVAIVCISIIVVLFLKKRKQGKKNVA